MDENRIEDLENFILPVCDKIVKSCNPWKIFLISRKTDVAHRIITFKLGVVLTDETYSISETEQNLYMQIDSDVPFDLILYKKDEWERLKGDIGSFAWKINQTGRVLYER